MGSLVRQIRREACVPVDLRQWHARLGNPARRHLEPRLQDQQFWTRDWLLQRAYRLGTPHTIISAANYGVTAPVNFYDVTANGQRFLMTEANSPKGHRSANAGHKLGCGVEEEISAGAGTLSSSFRDAGGCARITCISKSPTQSPNSTDTRFSRFLGSGRSTGYPEIVPK
jgi:hypothetical protein